ncbi:hypothetical protein H5410_045585 [Solanum commersonii]|uniref:Uncharacterized protein n=1 Tax=Solanum commersonii TaxID=4109 RepID=A0A9J5XC21_SOLCO|nr:hypothetical protein H5410_045585 [Solanum commersonii]
MLPETLYVFVLDFRLDFLPPSLIDHMSCVVIGDSNWVSTNVHLVVGNLATRKPRGPTLLKDDWKLPPGKTIDVSFDSRNQSIGKEGQKLASFIGIVDMINERMSNNERSTDQPPHNVAWEGHVYSQVLGNEKSGSFCGLELGLTPLVLWGSKSSVENIVVEYSSNEVVQRLEQ